MAGDRKTNGSTGGIVDDSARLWNTLDGIREDISKLATAFAKHQENVEGRIQRLDEKSDELRADQEHSKESRAKIFERIEKHEEAARVQFSDLEKRIDAVELAPARKAAARADDNSETIRREIIKRLTALGVGIVLLLVFLLGSRLVLKDFAAVLPKTPAELVDEATE